MGRWAGTCRQLPHPHPLPQVAPPRPLPACPPAQQKIEWKGWGVFDARKLLSNTDTEPRFSQIKVR